MRTKTTAAPSARTEDPAEYRVTPQSEVSHDDQIINKAIEILTRRLSVRGQFVTSPGDSRNLARLKFAGLEHEVFAVAFLSYQHELIEWREMFRGTVSQTSVYPREVVKAALQCNASAVILAHNHPSGMAEPSRADEFLTQTLKAALALVDVRVIDHLVVGDASVTSFAERGLL